MLSMRFLLRLCIYALIVFTFFLGLPQVHYVSALMIAIIIRHKNEPKGIFGPINSTELKLPLFSRDLELSGTHEARAQRDATPKVQAGQSQHENL